MTFTYKPDLVKIQADEKIEIGFGCGYKTLTDSFWIVRLFEDNEFIIGIIQNELNWNYYSDDGEEYYPEGISEEDNFNYGDAIKYNKETKKITNYDHED